MENQSFRTRCGHLKCQKISEASLQMLGELDITSLNECLRIFQIKFIA